MRTIISTTLSVSLLCLATIFMTGCYTVEGAGRDVAATGAGVAAGAEGTREYGAELRGPGNERRDSYQDRERRQ